MWWWIQWVIIFSSLCAASAHWRTTFSFRSINHDCSKPSEGTNDRLHPSCCSRCDFRYHINTVQLNRRYATWCMNLFFWSWQSWLAFSAAYKPTQPSAIMSGKHRIEPICQISMRSSIQGSLLLFAGRCIHISDLSLLGAPFLIFLAGASTKIVHNSVQAPMTGAIICIAQGVTFASTSTQSD